MPTRRKTAPSCSRRWTTISPKTTLSTPLIRERSRRRRARARAGVRAREVYPAADFPLAATCRSRPACERATPQGPVSSKRNRPTARADRSNQVLDRGDLRSRRVGFQIGGDFDLIHEPVAKARHRCANEQKRAEKDDRDSDRSNRGKLHAGVAREIAHHLTQKELDLAPVQDNSSPVLRR